MFILTLSHCDHDGIMNESNGFISLKFPYLTDLNPLPVTSHLFIIIIIFIMFMHINTVLNCRWLLQIDENQALNYFQIWKRCFFFLFTPFETGVTSIHMINPRIECSKLKSSNIYYIQSKLTIIILNYNAPLFFGHFTFSFSFKMKRTNLNKYLFC